MAPVAVSSLTPELGVKAMLGFYRDVRAQDCDRRADGDMLLVQWGTYDWGEGEHFEFDITRQFMATPGEDDDIWQLSLTFGFLPETLLRALGEGSRWCPSPDELPTFEAFVRGLESYAAVHARLGGAVELDYQCAG